MNFLLEEEKEKVELSYRTRPYSNKSSFGMDTQCGDSLKNIRFPTQNISDLYHTLFSSALPLVPLANYHKSQVTRLPMWACKCKQERKTGTGTSSLLPFPLLKQIIKINSFHSISQISHVLWKYLCWHSYVKNCVEQV